MAKKKKESVNNLSGEPDDTRDDEGGDGGNGTEIAVAVVAVAVVVITIASLVGLFKSFDKKPVPPATTVCFEACYGFVKLECPGDRLMGACFGFSGCGGNPHPCGKNS